MFPDARVFLVSLVLLEVMAYQVGLDFQEFLVQLESLGKMVSKEKLEDQEKRDLKEALDL